MSQYPTESLTNAMIRALRTDSGAAGDTEQVRLCDLALEHPADQDARVACAAAISAARAMDDSRPYVEVIAD